MNSVIAVKLLAGPLVISAASIAGKRWGPAAAGLLGGLPLIASCVIAALWLEFGQDYAVAVASAAPAGLWANIGYMLALGFACRYFEQRRLGWLGMLLCGWLVYLLLAIVLAAANLAHSVPAALLALPGLLLAARFVLPKPQAPPRIVRLPRVELFARMAAALLLVGTLTGLTRLLGPGVTGILSPGPVAATVIPAFTLANAGSDAVLLQLRGFLTGLIGTGVSFMCLAPLAAQMGAWAVLPATLTAVGAGLAANWLMQRSTQ
ncbi:hypothetical protein IGB42_04261 [Andreprevotia sp. IGB-42]|uniref:hypothetical protein n=1 Tax=Andreprevotia sp. IGB-42 TaxID=2497473 RepID=UPI00135B193B|nr:hypothetical protein [Andreprevotia sp. IGB-42]KAF0811272.1 hypothetical protein IGB42_04261 [Andreprevotia sp. IGB-42]